MKYFKKTVTFVMVMLLVVSMFSSCKKNETTSTDANTTSDGSKDTKGTTSENTDGGATEGTYEDYSQGFKETVTLKLPIYERGWEGWNPTDNYWTDYIKENFGEKYNVEVEFISIGRSTEVVDYKQLLAAGSAPDIIFNYDYPAIVDYFSEGAYQSLDVEEIENYAPTFWENMGKTIKEYGVIDGEQKVVMGDRVELISKNYITMIRQDWIDDVGKEMPTSLEELNALLVAWKEAGLGYKTETLQGRIFVYDYAYRDYPTSELNRALYSDLFVSGLPWKASEDYLRNMNAQWNEDLISKEFYLDTDGSQAKADFLTGRAGIWGTYLYSASITDIENLLANDPEAKLSVLDAGALVPEGNEPQGRYYWPFGMIFGINVYTSDEARAAAWMYLEWMSDPEVLFTLQNGYEGTHYELDGNGLPVSLGYTGEQRLSNNDNADYWCLITANKVYGSEEKNELAAINSYGPAGYEYLIEDTIESIKETAEYYSPDIIFTVPITTLSEYSGDLASLYQELYVEIITSDPSEFDALYSEAVETYLGAGFQEILDEKEAAFEAGFYN